MAYLVGTDEAGYGPNLGPLVIAATVWQVPDGARDGDLYELLQDAVGCAPSRPADASRLVWADSKLLYRPGSGLAALEQGVLAALGACGLQAASREQLWDALVPTSRSQRSELPWHDDHDVPLPVEAARGTVERQARRLQEACVRAGVQLRAVRCRAVFPAEFNAETRRQGSKGTALSRWTLQLVGQALHELVGEPVLVVCDKHGGRNHYAGLLQELLADDLVRVEIEERAESIYRWDSRQRPVEVRFRSGGERFLPAALASMTAKYLRELAMRAFNQFWCRHVPHLRPTAGYPVDARRFKREIEPAQRRLAVADDLLWRER